MRTIISVMASDVGYGNDKIKTAHGLGVVQSAVVRPRSIGQAARGLDVANRGYSVEFDGETFMTGRGSWNWGNTITSYDYSDLTSPRRLALFYTSFARVHSPGNYQVDMFVIGLPVPLLQDDARAALIQSQIKTAYMTEHTFTFEGDRYNLTIRRGRAISQPVGAYANYALDDEGHKRRGLSTKLVGIADLGMHTFDLYGVRGFRAMPRWVGGSSVGVRSFLRTVNGAGGGGIESLDALLRAGRLDYEPRRLDAWLASVLGATEHAWTNNLRQFDLVIPVGGGVSVLGEPLRQAFVAMGATIHWPQAPILENVNGLYKLGTRLS